MKIKERHCIKNKIKKNTNTDKVDDAFKTLKEEMDKYKKRHEEENPWVKMPYITQVEDKRDRCLHKNCEGCKNGRCSGVHMISCPCRDCTPWTLTTDRIGYNTVGDTGNRQVFYGKTF